MSLTTTMRSLMDAASTSLRDPRGGGGWLARLPMGVRGGATGAGWSSADRAAAPSTTDAPAETASPFRAYFDANTRGPGIWKWNHYFDVYHRHLAKFVGREVTIVEIGVYSGGSLGMWRSYFGAKCRVIGIDIEQACTCYAAPQVEIMIGDQADRGFWKRFRDQVPSVDIVIDDGGHTPHQQMVTLEETLPHIRPGGVYLCEDVHGLRNRFAAYAQSLTDNLNAFDRLETRPNDNPPLVCRATPFQATIQSTHFYPYVVVIEKHARPVDRLYAGKNGTEWQPFKIGRP